MLPNGFSDLHQHLVWGMDDGPQTEAQAQAMLEAAYADGIRRIAATSHVAAGICRFDAETYQARLKALRAHCAARLPGLELLSGAEIRYTHMALDMIRERRLPTIADSDHVLVEFWPEVGWDELRAGVEALFRNGYIPIVAHIERYACMRKSASRAIALRAHCEARYQVNADSVLRRGGPRARLFLGRMFKAGAIDLIASDAHNLDTRPPALREAHRLLGARYGQAYADALCSYGEKLWAHGEVRHTKA